MLFHGYPLLLEKTIKTAQSKSSFIHLFLLLPRRAPFFPPRLRFLLGMRTHTHTHTHTHIHTYTHKYTITNSHLHSFPGLICISKAPGATVYRATGLNSPAGCSEARRHGPLALVGPGAPAPLVQVPPPCLVQGPPPRWSRGPRPVWSRGGLD